MIRVASLLPAGTEIVAALGAIDRLVAVSHECDFPAPVRDLPRATWTPVDPTADGARIDARVRELQASGRPAIVADGALLRRLQPDLLITQDLCEVCAVLDGDVRALANTLSPAPDVLPLRARTLDGLFDDIRRVGAALDCVGSANELVASLVRRLGELRARRVATRPTVVCIEWVEPLYLAGHWVPEQIEAAGGRDLGAEPGAHSTVRPWEEVERLAPDLILVALCGFSLDRAVHEWRRVTETGPAAMRRAVAGRPVWAIDGNAYTSRPGPRLVDGADLIAAALRGEPAAGTARL